MANVRVINPTIQKSDTLRVAAYCRVSSDSADQLHSYAAQIKAYTRLIDEHDGWELVDIYADEGLTGTRMDKREDFQRLMYDCRKGKIDKVVVKSISRFARNTRDCLVTLRELSSLGVTVKFEKENIDTGTLTSELMVSVFGTLAQEESISISKNQRISYRRRMERGEFITCKAPFGYRLVDGKNLEIVPEKAAYVRWMYEEYLNGRSLEWLAERMTGTGIPTTDGCQRWNRFAVTYILTNEKYVGDALCQKTYSSGFPFVKQRNHGERDQYYVEHTHPALISREMFDKVQELLRRKGQRTNMQRVVSPMARKITCGHCGSMVVRRVGKSGYTVWVCHKHDRKASSCPNGRISEQSIHAAFLRMYHKLKANEGIILQPVLKQLASLTDALNRGNPAMLTINEAIAAAAEQNHNLSKLHTAGLLDAKTLAIRQAELNAKMTELRRQRRKLLCNDEIDEQVESVHRTMEVIQDGPDRLDSFDDALFALLVERIIAESQMTIRFQLYGGLEFTETLEER